MRRLLLPFTMAVALAMLPSASPAQQGRPYSLEQVRILIEGGLPANAILKRTSQDCLSFRLDGEAERQLRAAGADDQLVQGLRSACVRLPVQVEAQAPVKVDSAPPAPRPLPAQPAAVRQAFSPAGAAIKSLFVPGLGQFGTRRPAIGAVFLAGGAGALAFGLLSQKIEMDCLARTTDNTCPSGSVRNQTTKRPMLVPGLAAFVGVGVISAIEAASGARRANARLSGGGPVESSGAHLELAPALLDGGGGGGATVGFFRLRF